MKETLQVFTCDRCGVKLCGDEIPTDETVETTMSQQAHSIATAMRWDDICEDCMKTLNAIVEGSDHKLVPKKRIEGAKTAELEMVETKGADVE